MTPDWLQQQMPWLQFQQSDTPSLGQGIAQGAGALASAYFNRRRGKTGATGTTIGNAMGNVLAESPLHREKDRLLSGFGGSSGGGYYG